jgi:MFS family permease
LTTLSVALAFLTSGPDTAFIEPEWAKKTLQGTAFVGTLFGMLFFGYAADRVGRRMGTLLTLTVLVVGSAGSALLSWGSPTALYAVVCAMRFCVGVGCGGLYPCAFATVAEGHHGAAGGGGDEAPRDSAKTGQKLGWSYFWQMPASMAPYALGWALAALPNTAAAASIQFRLLLAAGLLPAAVAWWAAYTHTEPLRTPRRDGSVVDLERPGALPAVDDGASVLAIVRAHPRYLLTLLGTGGAWAAYDCGYWGTALFTPDILASIFGDGQALSAMCWQALLVALMGIPGTASAIWVMRRRGARWLSVWGFVLLAAVFAAMGLLYVCMSGAAPGAAPVKFVVFCILAFALSWGPSVGVHVLAAKAYPTEIRATFIGLSAACGKVGGLVGSFMFTPIAQAGGTQAVMFTQVGFCLVGALLAHVFMPHDAPGLLTEPSGLERSHAAGQPEERTGQGADSSEAAEAIHVGTEKAYRPLAQGAGEGGVASIELRTSRADLPVLAGSSAAAWPT